MVQERSIHHQISWINRFIASSVFIMRHIFPNNHFLKKVNEKNVGSISSSVFQGKHFEVDRITGLSDSDFVKNYLNKGLPVIFEKEAKNWACTKKWSLDFLKSNYGSTEFSVIDSAGLVESSYDKSNGEKEPVLIKKVLAKDYVDAVRAGEKTYLRFCPIMETQPELLADLNHGWLKKMRRCFLGISYQTFIGPKGRKTPLHSETTAFFYVMASGQKKWTLFSPTALALIAPEVQGRGYNFSKVNINEPQPEYPGFSKLTKFVCTLNQGDILFVPAWMWHEVENLTESWGVSYRFTSLRGFLRHPAYFLVRIFLTKPSFFEILYYSFFRNDISTRDKNLLTPRIFLRK